MGEQMAPYKPYDYLIDNELDLSSMLGIATTQPPLLPAILPFS
jgi:hypothetical protein